MSTDRGSTDRESTGARTSGAGKGGAVRTAMVVAALFFAGWGAAHATGERAGARRVAAARAPAGPPTDAAYDSATAPVRGTLTPGALALVRSVAFDSAVVLVVLKARDCLVCEDLGRQLREVRRIARPGLALVVATDSASEGTVRRFLRREHVRHAGMLRLSPAELLRDQAPVQTPALVVADPRTGAVAGVSHPRRFGNTRARSFAQELDTLIR